MKMIDNAAKSIWLSIGLGILLINVIVAQEQKNLDNLETTDLFELNIEDLLNIQVITASKKAEKINDAPGIISTVSSEEIRKFGANNIFEILQMVPSIQPLSSHLYIQNKIGMRGDLITHVDNHILVLINGRPIREGTTGGVNSSLYQGFPVEIIERLEIIRGPGSVLYGTNAFVGVINIITKDSKENNSLEISAGGGSLETIIGAATGNVNSNDFNLNIGAKVFNQNGWDYEAITARPVAQNLPIDMKMGNDNLSVYGDASYKNFKLMGLYIKNSQNTLGILPYATFAGINKTDRYFLDLGYKHEFNKNWDASVNLTYDGADIILNEGAIEDDDRYLSSDYLAELTLNGQLMDNLNAIFGGVLYSRNRNSVDKEKAIKETYNQTHLSAYAQFDYKPIDQLKLIIGAQLNSPDRGDVDVVPRFGAIYEFNNELGAKVLYGQAFRSPWPLEQYIDAPGILQGNKNLSPEKIATTDLQLFYSAKGISATATYFYSKYTDLISRVPFSEGGQIYMNDGKMTVSGFEFESKATITSQFLATTSASYQNNEEESTALPNFMFKVGVLYKSDFCLDIGLFNTYYGKPQENKGLVVNPAAEAVNLLDATFTYSIPSNVPVELQFIIKNVLDTDYHFTEFTRGWVNTLPAQPGRTFYFVGRVRI